ncbi:MAG: YpdA family putative bacillithiol disulfide reductase [Gemmatimonadetes bacterium]|nr:YpdA family putative bacillithiol disulfide reductase [Gemmatimonadota bacterium]
MSDFIDLAVVGAGPCGIAVGAAAATAGLRATLYDRGCITNSLVDYPYYMTFFSTARKLEIGGVPFSIAASKPNRREALTYYRRVVEHYDLDVHQYEEITSIEGQRGDFLLHTKTRSGAEGTLRAKAVVVATGGFHEPNYLDVPGEDLPKVKHYYQEPYPFYDQDVLVVGAGNSSVESALETYRAGARVTMVHIFDEIDRGVKPWVVPDIQNRLKNGEIEVYWRHRIQEIRPTSVVLWNMDSEETVEIPNDWVLAMTGWRPDRHFISGLGIDIDDETGIPSHTPDTMESNVPGIYIAGVLAAGYNANKIFIENGKFHGPKIVEAVASSLPDF